MSTATPASHQPSDATPAGATRTTPLNVLRAVENAIQDSYIVLLSEGVDRAAFLAADRKLAKQVTRLYNPEFLNAFVGTFNAETVDKLRNSLSVEQIEENGELVTYPPIRTEHVEEDAGEEFEEQETVNAAANSGKEQTDAPWGVARLGATGNMKGLNDKTSKQFKWKYLYPDVKDVVTNPTVYLIDSGVKASHADFQPPANTARITDYNNEPQTDYSGHGTHVAGTILGTASGVAKYATIISAQNGKTQAEGRGRDTLIAVVDQVLATLTKTDPPATVVSIMPGFVVREGDPATLLDQAVSKIVDAGFTVVVPANNDNKDVLTFSPARARGVLSVGALGLNGEKWPKSNFGVDLWAPGVNIMGPDKDTQKEFAPHDGTCMAAAHVAGLAALFLGSRPGTPKPKPEDVKTGLQNWAEHKKVSGLGNKEVYVARTMPEMRYKA